jgi:ABC-type antimicrobial peptide transport system permease subunit
LKPGVSFAAASEEFRPLYQEFDKQTPNIFPKQFKISVRSLADSYTRDLKKTMYLLFGAVALLLAIGCGNVSILLLARGTARQHEFAVRSAVGASGFRIVRQLLTESLLLSLIGSGLGVFVAYRSIGFIFRSFPTTPIPTKPTSTSTCLSCFSAWAWQSSAGLSSDYSPRSNRRSRKSARSCRPARAASPAV